MYLVDKFAHPRRGGHDLTLGAEYQEIQVFVDHASGMPITTDEI